MLLRNIAVGGLLIVLFAGIVLSLASVARLRGFTPEIYVFSQPPEVFEQLTDEHVAACIDAFSDGVCSHLDYLRHVEGDTYEPRVVTLGKSDPFLTEILSGLEVGERYVVANSYLIKADLEKEGVEHDH